MKKPYLERRLDVEELERRLVPSAAVTSTNWSGYAVQTSNNAVTSVSGNWKVPTVSGSGTAYSSTWVGIDGNASSTVEQIGTEGDVYNGVAEYYAWYEMYPNYSVTIPMTVSPGDSISATVTYLSTSGGNEKFSLQITDTPVHGSVETYTTTQTISGAQRSSAEWIEEAPSSRNGILPMADFGSVTFTRAKASIGGTTGPIDDTTWANTQLYAINKVSPQTGATQDTTSGITDSGSGASATSSFTITYVAPSTTPTPAPPRSHDRWWFEPMQVGAATTAAASGASTEPTMVAAALLTTSPSGSHNVGYQGSLPASLATAAPLSVVTLPAVQTSGQTGAGLVGGSAQSNNVGDDGVDSMIVPDTSNGLALHVAGRELKASQGGESMKDNAKTAGVMPLDRDACFIDWSKQALALETVAQPTGSEDSGAQGQGSAVAGVLLGLALGAYWRMPDVAAERRRWQGLV